MIGLPSGGGVREREAGRLFKTRQACHVSVLSWGLEDRTSGGGNSWGPGPGTRHGTEISPPDRGEGRRTEEQEY